MASSNEDRAKTSSQSTAIKAEAKKPQEIKSPKPTNATPVRKGIKLAVGTAIVALIAGLYAGYNTLKLQQTLDHQTVTLTSHIEQLKQQQIASKNDLSATTQLATQSQIKLQTRLEELTNNLQSAMQQQLYQKHDWLLLKARYYLELAQINTHWSKDPETSIALLQQADTLLAAIADQQLFSVRQTIAKDIAQLQALPKIDIAGLLSQLDAIQTLIANLPLKLPFNSPSINAEEKNTTSTWQERLKQNMHSLKKLVVIRRHEENFKPLLSPTYHALLCESIQLNLQQAQWAILQNNPAIYQLSLSQALKEIKQTFDENAQETQSLVKQIQVLQQVKLVVPNPDIDESLLLLNQAIAAKTSPLETTSNPQGEKAK